MHEHVSEPPFEERSSASEAGQSGQANGPERILALQRSAGNAAVSRSLAGARLQREDDSYTADTSGSEAGAAAEGAAGPTEGYGTAEQKTGEELEQMAGNISSGSVDGGTAMIRQGEALQKTDPKRAQELI